MSPSSDCSCAWPGRPPPSGLRSFLGVPQARWCRVGSSELGPTDDPVCYLPASVIVLPMPVTKSQPVFALKLLAVPLRMSRKFERLIVSPLLPRL